jgi:hypothetical protein
MSDLYLTDIISEAPGSSRHNVFYPGDCFVIWFDPIDILPDWVPVPNEIDTCEFRDNRDRIKDVLCSRLSDFAIKLELDSGVYLGAVDGFVGKIQNTPLIDNEAISMTVNRVDFYDKCGVDASNMDTLVATETTAWEDKYTIDIS